MKNAQIGLILILAMVLCLFLFACEENPTHETNPPIISDPTGGNDPSASQTGTVDVQTLREGNWNTCMKGTGRNAFLFAEGGLYYVNNGFLHFFDTVNRIDVTLCQKVGCKHERGNPKDWKNCEASLKTNAIFCYDNGYLYYDKDDHGQHLYRRNPDGTAETYIATLWKDYAGAHDIQVLNYILSDGFLYYTIQVNGGQLNDEGVFVVETLYMALLRLDLASGKEEEILRVCDATSIGLIAAKRDAVVYTTMSYQYYLDYPNGVERYEAMLNTPRFIHLWTKDANTSQELLCKPYKNCTGVDSFEFGKINFYDEHDTYYTCDLITGETQILSYPGVGMGQLNEQYCLRFDGTAIYDLQTNEDIPNEFVEKCPAEFVTVNFGFVATSDTGAILNRYYLIDDGSEWLQMAESYTFYVSFASLADGLQIEDTTDFEFWPYED